MKSAVGRLVLIGLAVCSAQQAWTYQDDVVLWSRAQALAPTKPRPLVNLGVAFERRDDWDSAKRSLLMAEHLASDPGRPDTVPQRRARVIARYNLARLAARVGECQAVAVYARGLQADDPVFAASQQPWFDAVIEGPLCHDR